MNRDTLRYRTLAFEHILPVMCLFIAGLGAEAPALSQDARQIYEPVWVTHPPDNAFNQLVQLPDGSMRHYGFEGDWFHPSSHVFIGSVDNGLTWNKVVLRDSTLFTDENMPAPVRSPFSGDYIRIVSYGGKTYIMRSQTGIDGPYSTTCIDTVARDMIRQPLFQKAAGHMLVTCGMSQLYQGRETLLCGVYCSQDDGYTWRFSTIPAGPVFGTRWPHQKSRWQNFAIEPTVAELHDGRLWMLLRTSMDYLYESYSGDQGATWSVPAPAAFHATLTMPTLFRLCNGKLLLFFCNTRPMPEIDRTSDTTLMAEQKDGRWEDVFTNRDVLHVAASDDDGKTWYGFREVALNPMRNDSDFATRGGTHVSLDKSVHQSQAVELSNGKVLLAFGQHPLVRGMVIFDPAWLTDSLREDHFEHRLDTWSVFSYKQGIRGHCAYNREQGPSLVTLSDQTSHCLWIRHQHRPDLVCDAEGAVWNFPAARKGIFTMRLRINPGSKGGTLCLTDHWINPTDTLAGFYAQFRLHFDGNGKTPEGITLPVGEWVELKLEWTDVQYNGCQVTVNGNETWVTLPLINKSVHGISYVHFQSVPDTVDLNGYYIASVQACKLK